MSDFLKPTLMDHVNMKVKNLDESVKFYKDLFGFEVKQDQPEHNSKIIGNDKIKLCMYEDPQMSPDGGLAHFGFHIENFDRVLDKCKELNVEVLYGGIRKFEKSRSAYIKEPSGYEIELSEVMGGGL